MRFFFFVYCLAFPLLSFSQQDSTVTWILQTTSGESIKGAFLSQNDTSIVLLSNLDTVVVSNDVIEDMYLKQEELVQDKMEIETSPKKRKGHWKELHSATTSKYILGNNAIGLKKGQGYFQNTLLLYNELGYGLTNWLSMHFSFVPVILDKEIPIIFSPALNFNFNLVNNRLSFGAKCMTFLVNDIGFATLQYYLTFGNVNYNVTAGVTDFYYSLDNKVSRLGFENSIYHFKGMARVSRKSLVIIENNFKLYKGYHEVETIILGFRHAGESLSFSYAVMVYRDHYWKETYPLPFLTLTYNF